MHKAIFHAHIEYSNICWKYHSIDKSWPNTMDRTVKGFSIWIWRKKMRNNWDCVNLNIQKKYEGEVEMSKESTRIKKSQRNTKESRKHATSIQTMYIYILCSMDTIFFCRWNHCCSIKFYFVFSFPFAIEHIVEVEWFIHTYMNTKAFFAIRYWK